MAAASTKPTPLISRLVPRLLEPRVEQLRRDLRSVYADLRGQRRPVWLARDGSRYADAPARPSALATRELEVAAFVRETDDAVSLVLRDPSGAELPAMRPGQFFTLLVELDGVVLRRAYSLSHDCRDRSQARIAIKRVAGGRVSGYFNALDASAAVGMRLRVLGPSGEFGCAPEPDRATPRKLVLIAGGSGITPMMALMHTLLGAEANCEIALIYANRRQEDTIFADEVAALEAEYTPRLRVHRLLEQSPSRASEWSGIIGLASAPTLSGILDGLALAQDPEAEFMICGPDPMMDGARELLAARGVEAARVHLERFISPELAASSSVAAEPQALTIVHRGRAVELVAAPGQTVLEAGLGAGLAMPYSCAMGGCGACKVSVEEGEVIMREPNCLGPSERAAGQILACIASPISACRVRVEES